MGMCVYMCVCVGGGGRQTDRQRHRETKRDRDRKRDKDRERQREGGTQIKRVLFLAGTQQTRKYFDAKMAFNSRVHKENNAPMVVFRLASKHGVKLVFFRRPFFLFFFFCFFFFFFFLFFLFLFSFFLSFLPFFLHSTGVRSGYLNDSRCTTMYPFAITVSLRHTAASQRRETSSFQRNLS